MKSVGQDAAFDEGVELVFHELRQVGSGGRLGLRKDGRGMLLHQALYSVVCSERHPAPAGAVGRWLARESAQRSMESWRLDRDQTSDRAAHQKKASRLNYAWRQSTSGMMRFMNSSNIGTVYAVSPWFGLQIIPLAISELRVGASDVTLAG